MKRLNAKETKIVKTFLTTKEKEDKIVRALERTYKRLSKCPTTMIGDLWDLEKAIRLIREGKTNKAANFLADLDTNIREELTDPVWNWVIKVVYRV